MQLSLVGKYEYIFFLTTVHCMCMYVYCMYVSYILACMHFLPGRIFLSTYMMQTVLFYYRADNLHMHLNLNVYFNISIFFYPFLPALSSVQQLTLPVFQHLNNPPSTCQNVSWREIIKLTAAMCSSWQHPLLLLLQHLSSLRSLPLYLLSLWTYSWLYYFVIPYLHLRREKTEFLKCSSVVIYPFMSLLLRLLLK